MALRIDRIDFNPWGCFEDHSLRFSARVGDVDLIHGRNASGKSTTSRGERSLLYGIDGRTPDNHTFDYADLRIGAQLNLDGRTVELSRRKRRVGSLVGSNGETLPDDLLTTALGGLSADVYAGLFQVDNETLVRGGQDLLQGQGEVGASLFAAAAGISSLHRTLADLEAEADRWFNPRGRTTILHKRIAELRDAERRLRDATVRPAHHREMTRALRDDEEACEEASRQLRELDLDMRALERKRAIAPLLAARSELIEELAALAATPELPADATARRIDAQGRIRGGRQSLERGASALAVLDVEIAALVVDEALLARGEEVKAVKENIAAVNKAAGDRRKREGELQEARAAVAAAASAVGLDQEALGSLDRPVLARRALDACLSAGEALRVELRGAQSRLDKAVRDRDRAQVALAAAPTVADVAPLDGALTAALKAGAIGEQRDDLDLQVRRARREASERLAQLSPAPSSLAEIRLVVAPSRDELARAASQAEEFRRQADALTAELPRLADEEAELEEERRRLELEGEPPSAEALADARGQRDTDWARIRAVGETMPLGVAECDAFDQALTAADHLADRRTDHAAQIERAAAVHARAGKLECEREEVARQQSELRGRETTAGEAWAAAWSTTGLELVRPADALAWLDERDAIASLARSADESEEHADRLLDRERRYVGGVVEELRRLGHEVAENTTLEAAIARAQSTVADMRTAAAARASLETTVAGAEGVAAIARRDLDVARAALSEWENEWPTRRAEAGLPETSTPEAAQEIARAIDEGLNQLAKVADLERRIAGIASDTRAFEQFASALCAELAPDLLALEPVRAAATLETRLSEHESMKARRDSALVQRASQAAEVGVLESEIAEAACEINELIEIAGVTDARELPALEERAERVPALRQEIEVAERRVAEVGEGRFDELAVSAAAFDRDEAAVDLDGLRERTERLRVERDEVKERTGQQRRELADAETDVSAVEAAQEVALARAAVQEAAVAHAKAKLAATAVRRAIERYRTQHQDPLLRRANELFTRFTLGSFVELFVDVDERGIGVLIGRQRDRVLKRVPQMSKGTREQLFLALRIAAIERYVATSGPVPVVFDDVFVESDAPRSERIFEALGELAALTQVIVLTHHEHLIEVGRRALGKRIIAQDLPDAAPKLREAAAA